MNKDEGEFRLPSDEELAAALKGALGSIDKEQVEKTLRRNRELTQQFPESAKLAAVGREAQLLHVFVQHYLPAVGMTVAKVAADGTLTPYSDEDEHTDSPVLIPAFFGIDPVRLAEEQPGLEAKQHQYESEDSLEKPDPLLAEQMKEFEQMLAREEEAEA